jgi:phage portal protein BeeE
MLDRLRSYLSLREVKASRTGRLIALEGGGRARWTPRDYAALTREGYARNAIVYRAVRLIAESIGGVSFVLYEGAAERDAHPLLDLIARPNPRQDGPSFLESVSAHLLLAGNAYIEAVGLAGDGGQGNVAVRELYALRPDRMKVVPGPDGWPQAYEYTVGGTIVRFDQTAALPPVLHLTLFNPLDDYYGLSPLEAARWRSIRTTRRRAGTRRCSTTRRGRPARWSMTGRTAWCSPSSSSSGSSAN